ncbi:MAG: GNAT family N-acetyltransferase [Fibrobacterales bacterium]
MKFETSRTITSTQFCDLLNRSTLGERRPVDNKKTIDAMLKHADILCTAWDDDVLIGVARSVTDFEYCCYLSDLAVDENYQRLGIGSQLINLTQQQLGENASLILLSAPKAKKYYPKIGFEEHNSAWIIKSREPLVFKKG